MLPYRSTHRLSDCDETFRSCCKHARGGFGNLIYIKITVCVCVPRIGTHTVHPIAMKLSQVVVTCRGGFANLEKIKHCTSRSTRCCTFPTGAHTVHLIMMKLSQVVVNMIAVVLEIKKKINFTRWSTRCCPTGAHTVHPIAMKLSQVVVNMLAMVLEIKKKIVLAGVPGVALQEHIPFFLLR